jgi:putative membrane protein
VSKGRPGDARTGDAVCQDDPGMPDDTWVRDRMAIERTSLANERTLLAYVRTAIALFAAGATAIHFLESVIVDVIGWIMIVGGVFVLAYGGYRFRHVSALISSVDRTGEQPDD